jgi:hypothetical protein
VSVVRFRPWAPNRYPAASKNVKKYSENQLVSQNFCPLASWAACLVSGRNVRYICWYGPHTNTTDTNMPLTEMGIRSAKPGAKIVKLSDGGGLQLWITPDGAKRWRLAYRFAGGQKVLAIGVYPATGVRDARAAREAAKRLLKEGADPGQRRRAENTNGAAAHTNTFQHFRRRRSRASGKEAPGAQSRANHRKIRMVHEPCAPRHRLAANRRHNGAGNSRDSSPDRGARAV